MTTADEATGMALWTVGADHGCRRGPITEQGRLEEAYGR
jgi:hypothetical protein